MRKQKRRMAGYGENPETAEDFKNAASKLRQLKEEYKNFTNAFNRKITNPDAQLRLRMERTQVRGFGRSEAQRAVWSTKRTHAEWIKSIGAGSSPLADLNEYYKAKAVNSRDFQLLTGYNNEIRRGKLSPLVGYKLFKSTFDEAESKLIGTTTLDREVIKGIIPHFVGRVIGSYKRLGVSIDAVQNALLHPIKPPVDEIVNGDNRRVYFGDKCMVTISVRNGLLIQTNPSRKTK